MAYYFILVRSPRVPALREAIASTDWKMWKVAQLDLGGVKVTRIILQADEPPPENLDIVVEAKIDEVHYCLHCLSQGKFRKLQPHNKSGYCYRHQDKDPKRSERKK